MNYILEKNKLYDYLGKYVVDNFKKHEVYVAGGAITSLFSNREINDIDVYFRSEDSLVEFIEEAWEDSDWVNALTKKSIMITMGKERNVQLIHFKYFSEASDIFNEFDFTACMGAFDFKTENFVLHDNFLKDNAQRMLRFNKNTAFPIVSLLRVQKYKDKGYTISKPEFIRIALKCMDLQIKDAEDLKEHLGGMYGINYDKMIQLEEGEEFSLDNVIDKIADLSLHEDYFKKPEEVKFECVEDIIKEISKEPVQITYINERDYRLTRKGTLKFISDIPKKYTEFDGKTYIENKRFYKFVNYNKDGNYSSHYDSNFIYKIGEFAIPKNDYLYFNEQKEINESNYRYQGALIEVIIPYEHFDHKGDTKVHAKKCFVVREVPREEYMSWIDYVNVQKEEH
ncbi:hypothetical protein NBRC13296_12640 [Paenibacillus chitinolyticus]|uniref:hypothetical protein n=1 Tax=Paenibacillus chitinolyticus TaxID=79263 RepID=UPI003557DF3F